MTSRKEKNYEENILNWPIVQPIQLLYSHSKKSLKNKVAAVCYNTIGAVATPYPLVAIPTVIIFPMKLTRK